MRDTIGTAYFSHADTVDVWTTFETEIIYNSTVEPDSMNIIIMASDITNAVHGSALLVDSLMFEYTTGVREAVVKSKQILTFPNPCNQQITFEAQNTLDNGSLEIYNMSGQLLYSEAATNKRFSVTTRSYPDGIYFYRLNSGADSETGSFIVSH